MMRKQLAQFVTRTPQSEQIQKVPQLRAQSNQKTQYFSFKIGDVVIPEDQTVAWQYSIPIINPNEKNIFLMTESFTTVILDFIGDTFPSTISIGLEGFSGFIGKNGVPTNRIIVMNLCAVTATVNPQGIVSRDLVYKNETTACWDLGSMRNMTLKLYIDNEQNPLMMPIVNEVNVNFKIVHLAV